MQSKKIFKRAPIPFQGQKHAWFKQFSRVIERVKAVDPCANVFDAFGGSGLLSYWAKHLNPSFNVIYNDFDNYSERLTHISDVNRLLQSLREIIQVNGHELARKLTAQEIEQVKHLLTSFDGYIDANCLNSWLMFTAHRAKDVSDVLRVKTQFFDRLPAENYDENAAAEYLAGLTIIHEDARDYEHFQTVIKPLLRKDHVTSYILDPPYLYTDKTNYKSLYFGLADTVNLLNYFTHQRHFILFNSDASGLFELIRELKRVFPEIDLTYEIERRPRSLAAKSNGGLVKGEEYALWRCQEK